MTATIGTLYRFKLHMFLGPIRRQPAAAVGFGLLALLVLPAAFALGYALPDTPFAVGGSIPEFAAFALSLFAAFFVVTAPGGGLLLQPAEVDFVAIGPVTVRQLILADSVFQLTVLGASLPAVALAAAGYSIRTGTPSGGVLAPVAAMVALLAILVLTVQTLGIARMIGKRWALPATAAIAVAFLAPAILRFALRLPAAYASLPFPTTAAVQIALLPFGAGAWIGLPVLVAYAAVLVAAHGWATARPSLPNLRGTFAVSFGLEGRRRQQEALLRAFGRFRAARGARLYRPTMIGTMAALHFVRMTRDGTLAVASAVAAVLFIPFLGIGATFATAGGAYVGVLLPVIAVGQWMAVDRSNLWVVLVSGRSPESFFAGWWVSLGGTVAVLGGTLAALGGLAVGHFDAVAVVASVGGALGGSAAAVICASRFPYAPNELSIRPFIHLMLTGIGAGLGTSPALAVSLILAGFPIAVLFAAAVAVVGIAVLSFVVVTRTTRRPVS